MIEFIAILAGVWIVLAIITAIIATRRGPNAPEPESLAVAVRNLGHAMIDPFIPAIEQFIARLDRLVRIVHWPGARR